MRRTGLIRLLSLGLAFALALSSADAGTKDLRVDGKPPAEYVAGQTGKSWAVVIGIDQYDHAPHLHYAVADARAMARVLEQQGFQVVTLYDREATKDTIEGELGDRLVDRVGENDRVLIFYSGHGETKTVKGGRTQGYLLPVGGKQDELARTAISMGRIRELADALSSKHVLFLVDVCYGGVAGTQFRALPAYTEEYLKAITRERGRQLITAGGPEQRALEGPEWGHSVFTYYLLEGLQKGLADLNSDGIIPASELYAYLDSRVFAAAQMRGHQQKPEMWSLAAEKGEFVFLASARPLPGFSPAVGGTAPSATLSQAERELQALQEQERQVDEEARQVELKRQLKELLLQRRIEEKRKQIEDKRKQIEEKKKQVSNDEAAAPAPPAVAAKPAVREMMSNYFGLIQYKIRKAWTAPPVDMSLQAVVRFRLHRSGAVTAVVVEKSSGNGYYDDSALRAVKNALPLPPFPPEFAEQFFDAHCNFAMGKPMSCLVEEQRG